MELESWSQRPLPAVTAVSFYRNTNPHFANSRFCNFNYLVFPCGRKAHISFFFCFIACKNGDTISWLSGLGKHQVRKKKDLVKIAKISNTGSTLQIGHFPPSLIHAPMQITKGLLKAVDNSPGWETTTPSFDFTNLQTSKQIRRKKPESCPKFAHLWGFLGNNSNQLFTQSSQEAFLQWGKKLGQQRWDQGYKKLLWLGETR